MTRFKKMLAVTLAAAMAMTVGTVAASSKAKTPAEKTKIEVWSWWGSEARMPVITHIIDHFNEISDTVEVEYIYTPWDEIFTKNLANIAAGTPADVIFNNMSDVAYRAGEGQTEDLLPLMERDGYGADQFAETYMEGLYYEDGVHGLPFVIESRLVYYNKEHLRSIGMDPDDQDALPKTWDELVELAYKLDIKDGKKYERVGFVPLMGGSGGWHLWLTNADSGRGFWDNETGDITIDTPNKLAVLERIMSVHDHYGDSIIDEYMTAISQGMQDPFGSGLVSFTVNNTTYARPLNTDFPELDYGTFLIPEFEEGSGHWANGGGFVVEIPKGAKNIDASWEFVKYMTSAYAQKYWSLNCFELSALKELADDEDLINDRIYSNALTAALTTDPGFMPDALNGWKDYLDPNLDLVKLRTMSPADALKKAQKDVEGLFKRQSK